MTRDVVIAGRTARIEVEGGRVRYETLDSDFVVTSAGAGRFSVLLKGRSYLVVLGSVGEAVVNGRTLRIEVFDPRDLRSGSEGRVNHGRQEVVAPMPGKIVRVLANPGDEVVEGQGLVVVEAMKMQNEMKSPKDGRVAEVRTTADATVSAGDVLVVIE